jgi:hypothetical protein
MTGQGIFWVTNIHTTKGEHYNPSKKTLEEVKNGNSAATLVTAASLVMITKQWATATLK